MNILYYVSLLCKILEMKHSDKSGHNLPFRHNNL